MTRTAKEKIIVALDVPNLAAAVSLVEDLGETITWVKIGLQLFTAEGPPVVQAMRTRGLKVFLDLKFHDIPHTALEAVRSAIALGAGMATIHLSGGSHMVRSAVEASQNSPLLVLGVTVLTSMDDDQLNEIGVGRTTEEQVLELVALGRRCGLRGVVCSPLEVAALRSKFGNSLTIVTPGVRPSDASIDDQRRVMTPADALGAGADYLVIGRPITAAASPRAAAVRLADEISETLSRGNS